ncbi:MAG TPA: alpha/beta hydrolase [Anaerolineales bacterium]|nr:alpha/beta hydrolase [Anaerolineales bacterium]
MHNRFRSIIVIAIAILVTASATQACTPQVSTVEPVTDSQSRELAGRWEGELAVMNMTYDIVVNFEAAESELLGWIDIPKQGVTGLELSLVEFESGKVHFEMKSNLPTAVFEGQLLEDGTLAGEYRQMGFKGTFALARAEAPVETPVVQESLPYLEEEVVIENGEVRLAGTLSLPQTSGPHPAIVLVSGSGLQDRNSGHPTLPGYEPFKWLADHLTRKGIAVLRYDDRGTGRSTGGEMGVDTTLDYASDTEAVLEYLLTRPDINPEQIGVLGHSEGAHIAAMVASRRSNIAFVISMAGMGVDGEALIALQAEQVARADGLDEEEIARRLESNRKEMELILAQDWDSLREFKTSETIEYLKGLPPDQRVPDDELDAAVIETVDQNMKSLQGWFYYFLIHDPTEDWERVQVPVLALFGEKDTQVSPVQNRPPLEAALARAGNKDVTVIVLPETNHLFQNAQTGGAAEYANLPMEFTPGLLETISDWILERVDIQ